MTPNLKQYQLTPKGFVTPIINLPRNPNTGDPRMRMLTSGLTDTKAELLLSRKDKKGEAFVMKKGEETPRVSSTSTTTKK